MNNYFFTFCDYDHVKIAKLHICTWDLRGRKASLELGILIPVIPELPERFDIYVFSPIFNPQCDIFSLHKELNDAENFKFIFNEKHLGSDNLGDDGRNGHIVRYRANDQEKTMAIVDFSKSLSDGFIKLTLQKYAGNYDYLYCRFFIQTGFPSLSERTKGIAKDFYKFDIKINERRNIPNSIVEYRDTHNLHDTEVSSAYCLHCVPDDYELSYSDSRKMVSLRILELDAFKRYMETLKDIKGDYIIAFQKDNVTGSFSFYTSFSRERIGNKQLALALIGNILCSFLFAEASWRTSGIQTNQSQTIIPYFEWGIALVIFIFCLVYCFSLWSRFIDKLSKVYRWILRK